MMGTLVVKGLIKISSKNKTSSRENYIATFEAYAITENERGKN